nr:Ig-like domain-containing protein [Devosia sp. WQ 349K1]
MSIAITAADTPTAAGAVTYTYQVTLSEEVKHLGAGEDKLTLDNVSFTVRDKDDTPASGNFDVEIVDDQPTANNDSAAPAEDQPIVIKVLDNDDKGADGVDLVTGVELETGPSKGSAVYNGNGSFTYTPTAGATGTDSFTYTITDKDGDSSTATVTITLAADSVPEITVNDPVAVVDEDGLGGANVDGTPLVSGEVDSTENASYTGTITVNYGNDVPADLLGAIKLATTGLDGQLDALGEDVIWALSADGRTLTGSVGAGATEVMSIAITAADTPTAAGAVTYTYQVTLSEEVKHLGAGEDKLTLDNVSFTVRDKDDTPASGNFDVEIVDDQPSAVADLASADAGSEISGDVLTGAGADHFGADGKAAGGGVVGVRALLGGNDTTTHASSGLGAEVSGTHGKLILGADGEFSYKANANVPVGAVDTFVYTIIDGDGDLSTTTLKINVTGSNLSASNENAIVDEAALPTGSNHSLSESIVGTLTDNVTGGVGAKSFALAGSGTGVYGTLQLSSNGEWTYTLTSPVRTTPSADNNRHIEDDEETFTYRVTDSNGNFTTSTITIDIRDDMPVAKVLTATVDEAIGTNTNLLLVLDTSGSMGYESGLSNLTRLQVLKAAVDELFEQYGNQGNVAVRIVTFAGSGTTQGETWVSLSAAKTIVDGLSATGGTNYDDAINDAMAAFASAGKLTGNSVQNVAYFISDGAPENGAVGSSRQASWEAFLRTNDIKAHALGMGTNVPVGPLGPIAYDGVAETDVAPVIVTDLGQLAQTLVGLASDVNGSLLASGSFGADGGYVASITIDNTSYIYNHSTGIVSGGGSFDTSSKQLTVALGGGASFSVNMLTGAYLYRPPAIISADLVVPVSYTLVDNDGDTASNVLTINVKNADTAPMVRNDSVITNVAAVSGLDPISIPKWALLWNDTDADGQAIGITAAAAISSLDSAIDLATSNVQVREDASDSTNGGKFSYTGTAGGKSDTAIVTISRPTNTGTTLDGTGLGEILLGRAGANNTLNGFEGNDVLIGNSGNDVLNGGTGADAMAGGAGNDVYNVDDVGDLVIEYASEGTDRVEASISYSLGDNLENLTLTGNANINGTGNALDNGIIGNAGNNNILGWGGNDTLSGGAGNDVIDGGDGNDTITGGSGADTLIGGTGDDTFGIANGDFVSGESIDGSSGTDTIQLTNATTVNVAVGTITNVERLIGSSGADNVTITAQQFAELTSIDLASGTDALNVTVSGAADISSAPSTTVSNTETRNVTGSSGNDTLTLSGPQWAAIMSGSGTRSIALGAGMDTLILKDVAGSIDLTGIVISGVENFEIAGNGANSVTMLAAQWAAFSSIDLGGGIDVLNILVSGAVNLSAAATTLMTGIETVNFLGSAGTDNVTLTGAQLTSLLASGATINLGGGNDTLTIAGGEFTGATNDQLQGIETVTMSAGGTLNLTNQTEGFNITGSSGADIITGGNGADVIRGGAGADILTGGNGADSFSFAANHSLLSIGGSGLSGTISGYDVITDFKPGANASSSEKILFANASIVATGTGNGANSNLQLESGRVVGSHRISNGIITFDDAPAAGNNNQMNVAYNAAYALTSMAHVAAAVQYMQGVDFGDAGAAIAFNATIGGVNHTFVFIQGTGGGTNSSDVLVDLVGAAATQISVSDGLISVIGSTTADPVILDLDNNGYTFTTLGEGATFDLDADGQKDKLAWNSSADGILAYDLNGNGAIDDGSELFTPWFNGGNHANGSAALTTLDTNGDGVVDANDEAFDNLSIWQDLNGNGITDEGELKSLAYHGITSLSASTNAVNETIDGQGVIGEGTFTRANGSTGGYIEVELDTAFGAAADESDGQTIIGTDWDDFLTGTEGDDIIIGGSGNDTLVGGAGADTFVFVEKGGANVSTIQDYVFEDGDVIDLTALLDTALVAENGIESQVTVATSEAGVEISVGGEAVAILEHHSDLTQIKIFVDGDEFKVDI